MSEKNSTPDPRGEAIRIARIATKTIAGLTDDDFSKIAERAISYAATRSLSGRRRNLDVEALEDGSLMNDWSVRVLDEFAKRIVESFRPDFCFDTQGIESIEDALLAGDPEKAVAEAMRLSDGANKRVDVAGSSPLATSKAIIEFVDSKLRQPKKYENNEAMAKELFAASRCQDRTIGHYPGASPKQIGLILHLLKLKGKTTDILTFGNAKGGKGFSTKHASDGIEKLKAMPDADAGK